MPDPSLWPVIHTLGVAAARLRTRLRQLVADRHRLVWMVAGVFGWIIEPLAEGDDDEPAVAGAAAH
jgi:cytochrome c oxidase subunit I